MKLSPTFLPPFSVYVLFGVYFYSVLSVSVSRADETQIRSFTTLSQKQDQIASCSSTSKYQIGIRVHLSYHPQSAESSNSDLKWLQKQFKAANQLFETLRVCFQVSELFLHPSQDWHMKTRKQRTRLEKDHLGKSRLKKGLIDLFIVGRLDDVDRADTQIRGVHWRHPKDRQNRRWIILSRIAQSKVLAHELGHYFSLPHSRFDLSIMNKTPRKTPMKKRGFVSSELKKMRRALKKMLKTKHLMNLK